MIEDVRRMSSAEKLAYLRSRPPKVPAFFKKSIPKHMWEAFGLDGKPYAFPEAALQIDKKTGKRTWKVSDVVCSDRTADALFSKVEEAALREAEDKLHTLTPEQAAAVKEAGGIAALYRATKIERGRADVFHSARKNPQNRDARIRYEVEDKFRAESEAVLEVLGLHAPQSNDAPEAKDNPRLLSALETWLKRDVRARSTEVKYRLHVRRFVQLVGNKTVRSVTSTDITEFVSKYALLPNARALTLVQRKLPMPQLLDLRAREPSLPEYGQKNVRKMLDYFRAFLREIKRTDLLDDAKKEKARGKKGKKDKSFDPSELRALLPAVDEQYGAGSDLSWWCWLLAHSGMRPKEGAQLNRNNIRLIRNVWTLELDDEFGDQSMKNEQSLRYVPIHPSLLERNFIEFATAKTDGLLFESFVPDDKGDRANNPSRKLKRVINRLGIVGKGSAGRFRHTFIDAMREAEVPYSIELGLVGHDDDNKNHGGYGKRATLKKMQNWIGRIQPMND
ncbi:MAG: tyrosine-type recombinase/integrase [Hyphomicrobiaceae bacterium]|nr:tyrosine-type recombinase/integrase [Hyphomicrobiaceae bacterium]